MVYELNCSIDFQFNFFILVYQSYKKKLNIKTEGYIILIYIIRMEVNEQTLIDDLLFHLDDEKYVNELCSKYQGIYISELVNFLESDNNTPCDNSHRDYIHDVRELFKAKKYDDAMKYYSDHDLAKKWDIFDYELLTYDILPVCLNNNDLMTLIKFYEVMSKQSRLIDLILALMVNLRNWFNKVEYKKYEDYPIEIMQWVSTLGPIKNHFIKGYIRCGYNICGMNKIIKDFMIFDQYMQRYPDYN